MTDFGFNITDYIQVIFATIAGGIIFGLIAGLLRILFFAQLERRKL
jgi:NhaP-type Na+/H+ or K+/H+ antiporter